LDVISYFSLFNLELSAEEMVVLAKRVPISFNLIATILYISSAPEILVFAS